MAVVEHREAPGVLATYVRALVQRSRGGIDDVALPEVAYTAGFKTDRARLAAFRRAAGYPEGATLPVFYPQVAAVGLQAALLTSPELPLRAMGVVHLRNVVTVHGTVDAAERLEIDVRIGPHRREARGLEVDLLTSVRAGGAVALSAVSTVLFRDPKAAAKSGERVPSAVGDPAGRKRSVVWKLAPDLGRRWAAATGDYNPIHLWPMTAKLFGYRRAIIHGTWSIARALAELDDDLPRFPFAIRAELKRPIFLPSRVAFTSSREGAFAIRSLDGQSLHLTGSVSAL